MSRVAPPADRATAEADLGAAFKRAMIAIRRLRGRETHRTGGLSLAQYQLLFGLAGHCARSTGELAEHAELAPGTVTQMLDALEKQGLVSRERSEKDRRVVTCVLTPAGEAVVTERRRAHERRWQEALAGFDTAELGVAAAVLDRLAQVYDEIAAAPASGG